MKFVDAFLTAANREKTGILLTAQNYEHNSTVPTLNGCINDAENLNAFLTDVMQYPEDNVKLLTDANSALNTAIIEDNINELAQGRPLRGDF